MSVRARKLLRSIRRRLPPPGTHPKVWVAFLLPWALLLAGAALAFVSYLPDVAQVDSDGYTGSVAANATVALNFTTTGYSHVVVAFEERPSCSLRLYALDAPAAELYQTSSVLPDPSTSLNCDHLTEVIPNEVTLFVIHNYPPQGPTLNYSFHADLFLVRQPYALFVLPGFAMFLGGAVGIIVRMMRSGLTGIVDDLSEEEPVPYWEEEKR